ncbi:MAG: methyltransferase domain-containing protein [Gemmatimonadota bacterium]
MVVVTSLQRDVIFDAVRSMYTEVAGSPEKQFHFPTGRSACVWVGYPESELERVPARAVESFAGVGYPFAANVICAGDVVLDIGSGSGTDVFIARELTGQDGRVCGLDMTVAMREKLGAIAAANGAANIEILAGNAESIPLPDDSVDVVTSNGVINLIPDKQQVAREIFRVLKPGGRVQIADIVLGATASDACRSNPKLWAECIVGATTEAVYLDYFASAGFTDIEVLARHDYFAGSASIETRGVAQQLGAQAMVMRAWKRT